MAPTACCSGRAGLPCVRPSIDISARLSGICLGNVIDHTLADWDKGDGRRLEGGRKRQVWRRRNGQVRVKLAQKEQNKGRMETSLNL